MAWVRMSRFDREWYRASEGKAEDGMDGEEERGRMDAWMHGFGSRVSMASLAELSSVGTLQ